VVACTLCGCAKPPTDPAGRAAFEQINDPLEPMNRKILAANMVFDKLLLRPVAKIYVTILPVGARDAVHRVLDNVGEPLIIVNNVLEGRFKEAGISVGRFALNTTVGIGGLLDVARQSGLKRQPADFGQTLYVWRFPGGPYLMLPILGPSNPRDGIGMGVDAFIDPISYVGRVEDVNSLNIGRYVLGGVDRRAAVLDTLDDLEKNSLDFYAELRSLSQQQRAAELNGGKPPGPGSNFYNAPGNAEPVAVPAAVPEGRAAPKPGAARLPAPAPAAAPGMPLAPAAPAPKPQPSSLSVPPPLTDSLGAADVGEGTPRDSSHP
jgi:phospholipid-binding lipoprotein MlaA